MSDLRELYQEVILDHARSPRNRRPMDAATGRAEGFNPLCGDRATVFVRLEEGRVVDASFVGEGCSISTASASLMTESVKGRSREEVERLFEQFHALVTAPPDAAGSATHPALGKLAVFSGVCEFPVRVKCASLAWHTLRQALRGDQNAPAVTTE